MEQRSLRLANKVDKEAGKKKRAREAEAAREHRAREDMADADEVLLKLLTATPRDSTVAWVGGA